MWDTLADMQVPFDQRTYSPRELAKVLGTSESTVKRWVDSGQVRARRTAGGHRRISVADALRAVREMGIQVAIPSALGIESLVSDAPLANPSDALEALLTKGDRRAATGVLLGEFLCGKAVWELADQMIRPAMQTIGARGHDAKGIYEEHRATQIVLQAVGHLRAVLHCEAYEMKAVACAVEEDPYQLPSLLTSAVLDEARFSTTNLGPNTPTSVISRLFESGKETDAPDLVAISVSVAPDPRKLSDDINGLIHALSGTKTKIAIGGRAIGELSLDQLPGTQIHTSMATLFRDARHVALTGSDLDRTT